MIEITNQKDLNNLPDDYEGRICINFGTPYNRAVINRIFKFPVVAWGNSSVVARGNSSVMAMENSSVVAWGNSSVVARGNSSVVARGNSSVVARGNSSVVAMENSSVVARENSSVEARGNSSVEAWENSSVEAWGNSQVLDRQKNGTINTNANARIVYDPKTIDEYINSIGDLEQTETSLKLYKAVHKRGGHYFSDNDDNFEYIIGQNATADGLTEEQTVDCGHGIHMADKSWCVAYGQNWNDLAILEVEAEKKDIVVPFYGGGKVRARSVKVIREVPLGECGLLGKILARKGVNNKTGA